jgi:hypothetical protein
MVKIILSIILFLIISTMAAAQKPDCKSYKIDAIENFAPVEKKGYVPFYVDKRRTALAVNSEHHGSSYSMASYTFGQVRGRYNIRINTLLEIDGEPTYKLYVNGRFISEVQNDPSDEDHVPRYLDFGNVRLKPGDTIGIAFNAHTNGKIPEGESTAFARGRWRDIVITHLCK